MTEKYPSTGLNNFQSSVFTHGQLRQVLSAYGEGVLRKNWRDYAIQSDKTQTTFCVIERGQGAPMAVIYSISATKSQNNNGQNYFRVYDGEIMVFRSDSFIEALNVFSEIGKLGVKKSKKFKIIK